MATLRIYDVRRHVLQIDLRHLLALLAPQSLRADWTLAAVSFPEPGDDLFDATGPGGERLNELAETGAIVSGVQLAALAKDTRQVIWGGFTASLPRQGGAPWLTIRAIDSTFYEVTTLDQSVLDKIRSTYRDVRASDGWTAGD